MLGCIYLIVLVAAVLWIVLADRRPAQTYDLEPLHEPQMQVRETVAADAGR